VQLEGEGEDMKNLEKSRDYLREWIERHKKNQDIMGPVQNWLEVIEWKIQAVADMPDEAQQIPLDDLEAQSEQEYDYLSRVIPMIPEHDPSVISGLPFVTASGSAGFYGFVHGVGELFTQAAQDYSEEYTVAYRDLQATQSRPEEIRVLLERLDKPQPLERFDVACRAYDAARSDTGERSAAALAMRNLIHGVQGHLIDIARKTPKEHVNWETIAERLSSGPTEGTEHQEILKQGGVFGSLNSQLSAALKDREGPSPTDLEHLWTQVLDHIYVVLGHVNL